MAVTIQDILDAASVVHVPRSSPRSSKRPRYQDDRRKLQVFLRGISAMQKQKIGLSVGWFADSASYDNGKTVASVAKLQEYGGQSAEGANVPPRPFMRPAFDANKNKWIDYLRHGLKKELAAGERGNLRRPFDGLGKIIQGDIQEAIHAVTTPPLSPVTLELRAKKRGLTKKRIGKMNAAAYANFAKPLEDTGFMVASVSYKVTGGGK